MSEHTLWSPSSLHRRLHCLGSANAEEGLVDETSEVAAEGTVAHWIREQCLGKGEQVESFVGQTLSADGFSFTVPRDWVNLLQPGIDFAREQVGKHGDLHVEVRVSLDAWMPGQGGTLDTAIIIRDKSKRVIKVFIIDLKFGRDPVFAERNPQLMAYALGYLAEHDLLNDPTLEVVLMIDQPRVFGRGDEWTTTVGEVLAFGERLAAAYLAGQEPDAPRTPEPDACKYCRASTHCPELGNFIVDLFALAEDEPMIPEADRLSVERLATLIRHAKLVTKTLEKYQNHVKSELENARLRSDEVAYKLVAGPGKRVWKDEAEAEAFLVAKLPNKGMAYNKKLISPAEAENLLGTRNWAKAQHLITVSPANPMLVPVSDKREELIPAINLLDDLGEELDELIGDLSTAVEDEVCRATIAEMEDFI